MLEERGVWMGMCSCWVVCGLRRGGVGADGVRDTHRTTAIAGCLSVCTCEGTVLWLVSSRKSRLEFRRRRRSRSIL